MKLLSALALVAMLCVAHGSWAPAPEAELRTIAGLLATTPSLSTLAAAAAAAGLVSALDSPAARLTVFAPTNDALDQLLAATGVTAQELLSDPAVLRALLSNHVVPGVARAADLYDGQVLTTLLGGKVQAKITGGVVTLVSSTGRSATVLSADIPAANGVVHVISGVLTPTTTEASGIVPAVEPAAE